MKTMEGFVGSPIASTYNLNPSAEVRYRASISKNASEPCPDLQGTLYVRDEDQHRFLYVVQGLQVSGSMNKWKTLVDFN